jgi:hypothetical protein
MSSEVETPYRTFAEIERLVSAFESCTLPREHWTHRAHLTVALWYLMRHEIEGATDIIRRNIQDYNRAHGVLTTRTSGYHETITLFFVQVVHGYLRRVRGDCSIVALFNEVIAACGDKNLPLMFYSKERLMSWEARRRWVEPDLRPLHKLLSVLPAVAALAPG